MFEKQKQSGGANSTNIQSDSVVINQGLTYTEVREIAMDIFHNNFMKFSEKAAEIARDRASEVTDEFLKRLEEQNALGLENAQDPDFQFALLTVQREYAKSGDKELGDLLVDLLVDRTKCNSRSLLQIVLNESLVVAPKLTNDQLSALSIIFLTRYTTNSSINNLPSFYDYLDKHYIPFAYSLSKNDSCYQHLEFTGCGTIGIREAKFAYALKQIYKGLFSKGFSKTDAENIGFDMNVTNNLFNSCLHDQSKIQVNAMSDQVLKEIATSMEIEEQKINSLIDLSNQSMMNDEEVENLIISERGYMHTVIDIWNESDMKNMTLTSVGMAIGHANVKRSLGEFTDLSIWIN